MPRREGALPPSAQAQANTEDLSSRGGRQGGPPTVRVVICSDGKRGHENQSRVLARMLGDTEPLIMHLRNPEGGWGETLLRAAFALRGRWKMPRRSAGERVRELLRPESPAAFREFTQEIGRHREQFRIFTVSTGTPPATGNLLLAALLDAEPLCVMTPSLLPRKLFSLQIVPEHDALGERSANAIKHPLALSYHDQQAAQFAAGEFIKEAGLNSVSRYWSVAIGGPSKSAEWTQQVFESQFRLLAIRARNAAARLLITTSRRTPPEAMQFARSEAADITAFFLDASQDERNPLPAYYELCEAAAVTADSFSMVCEAIQAGFLPYLIQPARIKPKLSRGLEVLQKLDLTEVDSRENEGIREVHIGRGEPNQHYEHLRAEVRLRLRLD